MKAIVMNAYGGPDVLELKEVDKPEVSESDVLVGVHASSLNAGDCFSMRGSPWLARFDVGFPKPKDHILGWDVAGQVEAVGKNVTRFQPGDKVFASCDSAFAEYACAPEGKVAIAPTNLSLEQAAAVPSAAMAALHALRDQANVQPGQKVLINGASGGRGNLFGADREGTWGRGDRRLQHEERRYGAVAWRGSRHRLHQRGLCPERTALRPHRRQRR